MRDLRHLKLWLTVGWLQVCLVIFFSLIPSPVKVQGIIGVDKLIHLFTYTFVMLWFGLCYTPGKTYKRLGICLILMGIVLELIQGRTGYRTMSYLDMTANGLGVTSGWLLAKTRLSGALLFMESRLASSG
jgi:hypothetical protein